MGVIAAPKGTDAILIFRHEAARAALLLGQLAVDHSLQGRGVGGGLMRMTMEGATATWGRAIILTGTLGDDECIGPNPLHVNVPQPALAA